MNTPTGKGRIRAFNPVTWWGEVEVSSSATPMKFHATCFLVSGPQRLPEVGEEVTVVFSDEALDEIVVIRAGARAERRGSESERSLQTVG